MSLRRSIIAAETVLAALVADFVLYRPQLLCCGSVKFDFCWSTKTEERTVKRNGGINSDDETVF